jgi:hypothetical protein
MRVPYPLVYFVSSFPAIAEALGSKVCVTGEKKTILDCLEDPSIDKLLTKDGNQAKVHVLKMGQLRHDVSLIERIIKDHDGLIM